MRYFLKRFCALHTHPAEYLWPQYTKRHSNERRWGRSSQRKAWKEESQEEQTQAEQSLPTSAMLRSKVWGPNSKYWGQPARCKHVWQERTTTTSPLSWRCRVQWLNNLHLSKETIFEHRTHPTTSYMHLLARAEIHCFMNVKHPYLPVKCHHLGCVTILPVLQQAAPSTSERHASKGTDQGRSILKKWILKKN